MNRIKKYDAFLEFVLSNPIPSETETDTPTIPRPRTRPGITPTEIPSEEDSPLGNNPSETETDTPTIPRPRTRPGITPTEIPSEEDSPLASGEKVIDRLSRIYSDSSKEERQEIDSYFQK